MHPQNLPLTFMFTDVVGSTRLWQRYGDRMRQALEDHDLVIKTVTAEQGGSVFAGGGDGFGVVFPNPGLAVEAASLIQGRLAGLEVVEDPLAVRIGIHTGVAQERENDYFGLAVNRAARLTNAGHGGQVLVSDASARHLDGDHGLVCLGEYQLRDLLEPMVIHQVGSGEFPPLRALRPDRHNLPVRYTSLVGRDRLIDEISVSLVQGRLVTLVGPGGIGKTSAAFGAAAGIAATSDVEVWLAELDQVVTPADVEPMIAACLGMSSDGGWHRVAAQKNVLLILDNAEHVVDQVADTVVALLRSGEAIRVLVTSRQPLQLPGEKVIDVPPLDAGGDAEHLFLERLGDDSAPQPVVSEVVGLTAGIPLALELVASQAGRVPLEMLVPSLRSHGLGAISARGVVSRHRTTTAAIGWSYDLLSDEEQAAFLSLAVFSQDFSLDGGAAVGATDPFTIVGLAERSLLQPVGQAFRLLEPVKEFARAKLDETGGWEEALDRYAAYVAAEVERVADLLAPRDAERWETELRIDLEDVIAAARRLIDRRDADALGRVCKAFPGPFGIHRRQLRRAVDDVFTDAYSMLWDRPAHNRWTLFRLGWCLDLTSQEPKARELVDRLIPVAEDEGDDYLRAACHALTFKIISVYSSTEPAELERLEAEAASYAPTTEWWEPDVFAFQRGVHALNRDDFEGARDLFLRVDFSGSVRNRTHGALVLAECDRLLGDPRSALDRLDGLDAADPELRRDVVQDRVHTLIELGRLDEARADLFNLVDLDAKTFDEKTALPFCAAADYFRAAGDHRAAVRLLSRMLDGGEPQGFVHRRVIEEAREVLGAEFEAEWEHGRRASADNLHALFAEEA